MSTPALSRRHFLRLAVLNMGGLVLSRVPRLTPEMQAAAASFAEFPAGERLARVFGGKTEIKVKPDIDSANAGYVYDDEVLPWLRELVGSRPLWNDQRFVETPQGYIYAANVQLVYNRPNAPLSELPPDGLWMEVTVPYVDLELQNPPARSPWVQNALIPRLYYSQVMWVDSLRTDDAGQVWYRVKEKYGTFGDIFWARAEGFRPLTEADVAPISPEVEEKRVVVDVTTQSMSCFEGAREVYFCRVSTGGKFDGAGNPAKKWATPLGRHSIWRKLVSVHMTGGTTGGGYDLAGIGWTTLFSSNGVAIHSTFWHNSYGVPKSHGCVNARPEDAQWVFRFTQPAVPYASGDVTVSGNGSTKVEVIES